MVGWPSAANGGGDALRFRYGRYDRDVGKQRQTTQRAVHVQRLKLSRRDHEYQFALRPLQDRCDRDRPHRRETGATGDKNNAAGMIWPEKGAAERTRHLYAVPDADFSPQLRGYDSVRESADVKMQHAIVGATLERIGRAVASRRKPPKLRLAELTGKIIQRFRQLDVHADHVRRQANHLGHTARHRDLIGDGLGHDLDIGDDSRLAGVNHVVTLLVAAKHPAFNEAHAAGTANPGATIVRQINAIHQGPVEHEVAAIRQVRLIVEGYLANLPHYSTSRRIGRTCRVCLI